MFTAIPVFAKRWAEEYSFLSKRVSFFYEDFGYGRVAQLVEQVTFNHWVTGSNPVALTTYGAVKPLKALAFGGFLSVCQARAKRQRKKSRE